jgi:hypothetical protein
MRVEDMQEQLTRRMAADRDECNAVVILLPGDGLPALMSVRRGRRWLISPAATT